MSRLIGWVLLNLLTLGVVHAISVSPGLTDEPSASMSGRIKVDPQSVELRQLWPPRATVIAGGSLRLVLETCSASDSSLSPAGPGNDPPEPLQQHCKPVSLPDNEEGQWSVSGLSDGTRDAGIIEPDHTPNGPSAMYHAPVQIPRTTPVEVSMEYRSEGSSAGNAVVVSHITVIDPPACEQYRNTPEMVGHMHFTYDFTGTNSRGDNLRLNQSATVTAALSQSHNSGSDRLEWRGPVHHRAFLGDGRTIGGAHMNLTGKGEPDKGSEMVLHIRLSDCTYQASLRVGIDTIETLRIGFAAIPDQKGNNPVGSVRTGMRSTKDGLSGAAFMTVGEQAAPKETDDRYHPGGLGKVFMTQGFATEDNAGQAQVSWSFGPAKQ